MNIYSFIKMPKQLLVLVTMLSLGAVSVSPAFADNRTDSIESDTEIETPVGESDTEIETPMGESDTEIETPVGESDTEIETPMGESDTEIETPVGESDTEIETPMGESDTEIETPVGESDTEIETPMGESDTEIETPVGESDTEIETPMGESDTEIETPVGESDTEIETPVGESDTEIETPVGESDTEIETPVGESDTEIETPMGESDTEIETPVGESATEAGNIVEVASGSESFNTLVQAIQAAELTDTLSDSSASYTVFAPTDEAFSQLPDGTLEYLLQPENKEVLQQVLSYHVLPTKVTSEEISGGSVDSLSGGLATAVTDKGVVINNASVINPDIQASNGIIHGINRVLLPADLQSTLASELGINEADIYQ